MQEELHQDYHRKSEPQSDVIINRSQPRYVNEVVARAEPYATHFEPEDDAQSDIEHEGRVIRVRSNDQLPTPSRLFSRRLEQAATNAFSHAGTNQLFISRSHACCYTFWGALVV